MLFHHFHSHPLFHSQHCFIPLWCWSHRSISSSYTLHEVSLIRFKQLFTSLFSYLLYPFPEWEVTLVPHCKYLLIQLDRPHLHITNAYELISNHRELPYGVHSECFLHVTLHCSRLLQIRLLARDVFLELMLESRL